MKVLVIGSGGREHTIVWKIKQSPKVSKIYCAPGNAGISKISEVVNIKPEDIVGLLSFTKKENIGLTIVGPEVPLALGIVDEFKKENLRIFGPNKVASQLESSKIFSKEKMRQYKIPTAKWQTFYDGEIDKALEYLNNQKRPVVIKADGLAQGKGVIVTDNKEEAEKAIISLMKDCRFQEAGKKIVIEERMYGEEASLLAFVDGTCVKSMVSAQDHKAIFDGDKGPNTGGMGAYSPAPIVTKEIYREVEDKILSPMIKGLRNDGIIYKGVLYVGLMITKEGPKVVEFNVRFGDPETQVILPRLKNDLIEIMEAVIDGKLENINLTWDERSCVCVVLSSDGYPGSYEKGFPIFGLDKFKNRKDIMVFHAGTKLIDKETVTDGGRILGVTAYGSDIENAIKKVYESIKEISFKNIYYRKDIGFKALKVTMQTYTGNMKKIILATRNSNKIKEIKEILGEDNFEFYTLESGRFSTIPEIPEDGKTFEENALKKAQVLYSQSGLITIADDSGLEVEALNGAPGVKSARYAGTNAGSIDLCKKLLKEMDGVAEENRKAKFVCCVVIMFPDGSEKVIKGETEGIILNEMRGKEGFGYDPVFFYPPEKRTFAQMTMEEKNKVSHRYKAFSKVREELYTALTSASTSP